jgi:uncharacterized protein (TIGR03083 family)
VTSASDLRSATRFAMTALRPYTSEDWSRPAGDLDWDCRDTLDHLANALTFYAGQVATRATGARRRLRAGDADASPAQLLESVESASAILCHLLEGMGPADRAWHPAGMADASGFAAMGVDEVLVHTHDISLGLGRSFEYRTSVTERVVKRLFPWAPPEPDPWTTLLWCNGRIELGDSPRLESDWWWWCEPLDSWDGSIKRRS